MHKHLLARVVLNPQNQPLWSVWNIPVQDVRDEHLRYKVCVARAAASETRTSYIQTHFAEFMKEKDVQHIVQNPMNPYEAGDTL